MWREKVADLRRNQDPETNSSKRPSSPILFLRGSISTCPSRRSCTDGRLLHSIGESARPGAPRRVLGQGCCRPAILTQADPGHPRQLISLSKCSPARTGGGKGAQARGQNLHPGAATRICSKGKSKALLRGKESAKKQPASKLKADYPSKERSSSSSVTTCSSNRAASKRPRPGHPNSPSSAYRPSLHSSLVKLQIRQGKSRIQDLRSGALYHEMTARIPRWIRINPLRASRQEMSLGFPRNHFTQVDGPELEGLRSSPSHNTYPGC